MMQPPRPLKLLNRTLRNLLPPPHRLLINLIQKRQPLHSPAPTRPLQRQKSKMPTNNRPSEEINPREIPIALCIMQVREWPIRNGFVDPARDGFKDLTADGLGCDGHGEEFPVRLCVEVPAVEWEAVFLAHVVVPY